MIAGHFAARIDGADDLAESLAQLRANQYDLVLVNRLLDLDGSDGLDIIRAMKADDSLASIPVMLVTNYPEYQARAVAEGAEPGFGKSELQSPATKEKLARFLAS
ncbi:MAG: response regulator [Pirellulales bacterium]|nr:response regulator [Pirellulales bacterium]